MRKKGALRWDLLIVTFTVSVFGFMVLKSMWTTPTVFSSPRIDANVFGKPAQRFHLLMESQRSQRGNGLGNQLFFYAAQLGIAERNNLITVVPDYSKLTAVLETSPDRLINDTEYAELISKGYDYPKHEITVLICCIYFPFTQRIHEFARSDVILRGAFQSWKYFHPEYREMIREKLSLKNSIIQNANKIISDTCVKFNQIRERVTLIGIHIRRGDILKMHQRYFGHVSPPGSYYRNAQLFMNERHDDVLYIVLSNDLPWAKATIQGENVAFVEDTKAEIALAVMNLMDNLIISVGTFSWWGAYLSNAKDVVYYSGTPFPGSLYDVTFRSEDFWLPEWTGLQ